MNEKEQIAEKVLELLGEPEKWKFRPNNDSGLEWNTLVNSNGLVLFWERSLRFESAEYSYKIVLKLKGFKHVFLSGEFDIVEKIVEKAENLWIFKYEKEREEIFKETLKLV